MYERLAVCMWASVSMRRAALCAVSVSSWGGTVRNARVLHVHSCRLANTARLRFSGRHDRLQHGEKQSPASQVLTS